MRNVNRDVLGLYVVYKDAVCRPIFPTIMKTGYRVYVWHKEELCDGLTQMMVAPKRGSNHEVWLKTITSRQRLFKISEMDVYIEFRESLELAEGKCFGKNANHKLLLNQKGVKRCYRTPRFFWELSPVVKNRKIPRSSACQSSR